MRRMEEECCRSWNRPAQIFAVALLIGAMVLRLWDWPSRYRAADDEAGYLCSSLVLVEGITPGYQPAPAGPQIWLGWVWAQAHVLREFLLPDAALPHVALSIRPFVAMNQALFALYRDLTGLHEFILAVNVALLLIAVAAAFGYGHRRGGIAAGILAAGLLATSPLMVAYSLQSRPYSMAWSFGAVALYAAAAKRPAWAGIFLGLAIGSRIEMLLLLPLVIWEAWGRRAWLTVTLITLLTAYVVAPWLLTGLPGNLRAIATIQFANPTAARDGVASVLRDFAWTNGFGVAAILFFLGIPALLSGPNRRRQGVLVALVLLLSATIFKSTGYGLRHHGAAILTVIFAAAMATGALNKRWPRMTALAVCAALALPLMQTVGIGRPPPAVSTADWVQTHVPAGTVLYVDSGLLKTPLPTPSSADAIWNQVTGPDAWRRKFAAGVRRFGLSADQIPRAMSEENLVQDHGSLRRWFILGSELGDQEPRYDIRLIQPSPIFGVRIADVPAEFARTGGVVFWEPLRYGPPPPSMGRPAEVLPDADGFQVLVFSSLSF